ncbi:MAG: acetate--CoA ligase family protein [Gammaproteobacteria bacterium]
MRRDVYRRADLLRLIEPRSVAVFGVSPNPGALGTWAYENLGGFSGRVYPVNARYGEIGGKRCYHTLGDIPEPVDCAVVSVPVDAVEAVIEQCAAHGVGGAVIFAAGFAETGRADRVALQERIVAIARAGNLRLVGPNCIGIINFTNGLGAMFNRAVKLLPARAPAVAVVSQSGAMGAALAQANQQGMSVSHMLAAGNSCDVDVADFVGYLAEDPNCASIACLFEGLADPRRFGQAAEIARAADKPLVVCKIARSESGGRAAMSHTASLAGSDAGYGALFRRSGAVAVDHYEALLETAAFFAKAGAPRAEGVAVTATSGGFCIMAADEADAHGVALPPPEPAVRALLAAAIPEFATPDNPCDMTGVGRANPEVITHCAAAFLDHPAYGALVTAHPLAAEYSVGRIPMLDTLAARTGKPICVVWAPGWLSGPGAVEFEQAPHLALFRSMARCFAALRAWRDRGQMPRVSASPARVAAASAREVARGLIAAAPANVLTEREAKAALAAYGVPVADERLAASADDAVAAAQAIGYPVVLKVESPDLPHKTEAGVIRLDLADAAAVRAAHAEVLANAARHAPDARINGVLVQAMAPAGVEIMVGARIDPLFGPLVVAGLGGVQVEIHRDTATELAPVSPGQARAMLERLRGFRLLTGFRGSAPVDLDRLAEIVARCSEFAADQADFIDELDVNPLICAADRILAVDALVVRRDAVTEPSPA